MKLKPYKNLALLVLLIALSALTYWLLFEGREDQQEQFSVESFSLPAHIYPDKITFESKGDPEEKTFRQKNQEWYLNETLKPKDNLIAALLSILQRIEAKRTVAKKQETALLSIMDSVAVLVKTYKDGELLNTFEIWGDVENKITYIKQPNHDKIYIAHIPGYNTYIAALFFLEEDQWENNILFESTPRSLRALKVEYPSEKEKNFTIRYNNNFFVVAEVAQLDTIALLDYLEKFSQIAVKEYIIDTTKTKSLRQKTPNLIVHIDDIDTLKSNVFNFFLNKENGKNEVTVIGKEKRLSNLPKSSFDQIAKTKDYFSVEGSKK